MEKQPLNGHTCIAWILQGPLDFSSELNWALFYAGADGVRDRFLDLWEFLASATRPLLLALLLGMQLSEQSSQSFAAVLTQKPACPCHASAYTDAMQGPLRSLPCCCLRDSCMKPALPYHLDKLDPGAGMPEN